MEVHQFIAWDDKDFKGSMDKLLRLATLDVASLITDVEGTEPMDLSSNTADIEDSFETIRDTIFLEIVYGDNSRTEAKDWVQIVGSKKIASWTFNAQMARSLIFDKSGVENPDEIAVE